MLHFTDVGNVAKESHSSAFVTLKKIYVYAQCTYWNCNKNAELNELVQDVSSPTT